METLKRSEIAGGRGLLWMGAPRAALWRRTRRGRGGAGGDGARSAAGDGDGEEEDEEARQDGEGGGRWRGQGPAAAVAGDGAACRRQVARGAAAGRDHRQGPQEL
jgi:hypothetical protein